MRTLLFCPVLILLAGTARAGGLPRDVSSKDLVGYLNDGGVDARAEACKRLGERRSPDSVADIGRRVETDPVSKVRIACLKALKDIGVAAGAKHAGIAALKDEDSEVRITALAVLENLDPKEGAATAAALVRGDGSPEVRKRALWAIEHKRWSQALPAVVQVLESDSSLEVRRAALKALKEIGSEEGYQAIHHVILNDGNADMRREAVEIVEHNPRRSSLEPLCKALGDKDSRVVSNAAKGLESLGLREGARCLRESAKNVANDRLARDMNGIANKLER